MDSQFWSSGMWGCRDSILWGLDLAFGFQMENPLGFRVPLLRF